MRLLPALLPLLLACSQQTPETSRPPLPAEPPVVSTQPATNTQVAASSIMETFEAGSKGAYAEADETLGSGSWHFVEGLIGASEQDHKNGLRAARLREKGRLRMNFNSPGGVRAIRISSATYGSDPASTWELWGSVDNGRTFRRIGQPIRTQGAQLVATTFAGGTTGALQLEIRKTDTGKGRLNIDDIVLETGTGTGGPVAGGGTTVPTPPPAPAKPQNPNTAVVVSRDDNMALGNPSGATASLSTPNNYLLVKPQFTIGYNNQRGTPIWVSWHLNRAWMGSAPRQDDFRPDPALPGSFYAVSRNSYSGSGFDKGHNCPSADRTTDLDDNSATFLMTNMIPQAANNNQRTWGNLEEWTRAQVQRGQEVYVVMGSYGKGGTGLNGLKTTIDNGRVTVPARVWKVLVVLPEGTNDLQRIAAGKARILAVDTPNDQSASPDWSQYRVSIDALEAATGLDLLSALPIEAQTRLQKTVDIGPVR